LPTEGKKLRGNPGKRALNDAEPHPEAGVPDIPAGMSTLAQQEWATIVPLLESMGVLTKIDGKALAAYCHTFARWFEAEKEIDSHGLIVEEPVTDKDGDVVGYKLKRNPAVSISDNALKIMKSFLVEFGMTPAARSRIRIEKKPEMDPVEAYLQRGKSKSTIIPSKGIQ
jgi:P27 family predicted phage terminase small subunit